MTDWANTFEGGTNGVGVTTANSGGTSGDAFGEKTTGTGAALTYDNTLTAHGSLAVKCSTGSSSVNCYVGWLPASAVTAAAVRGYFYFTANPATALHCIGLLSGNTRQGSIRINTDGTVSLSDISGPKATTTTVIPLNAWFRLSLHATVISTTVGTATLSIYTTPDSTTPTETLSVSTANFGASIDRVRFGTAAVIANAGPFWFDDIAANDTGAALGPSQFTGTAPASVTLTGGAAATGLAGTAAATVTLTAGATGVERIPAPSASAAVTLSATGVLPGTPATAGAALTLTGAVSAPAVQVTGTAPAAVTLTAGAAAALAGPPVELDVPMAVTVRGASVELDVPVSVTVTTASAHPVEFDVPMLVGVRGPALELDVPALVGVRLVRGAPRPRKGRRAMENWLGSGRPR